MKLAPLLLIFSALLLSFTRPVHQPELSSTLLVERPDGTWVLQVRASLSAFEIEVLSQFGKDAYATPEEFNALVIRHLREHVSITCNGGEEVRLENGYVKLGHETNVLFEMHGLPDKIKKVVVSNSSFKEIHDNQGALIILKKGFKKQQFMLNDLNGHTAHLVASKNQFELRQ